MRRLTLTICPLFLIFVYCEFFADFFALTQCHWPTLSQGNSNEEKLQAMIIADTHLVGPRRGHWLDRLYREWHMYQSFEAANRLFIPDVIFVLGDLFDEGDLVNDLEFEHYAQRFQRIFSVPSGVPIISAVGNHDIGFHYKMHRFTNRFSKRFNNTGVEMYTIKGCHFVMINSMAMLNDRCSLCEKAHRDLNRVSERLNCLKEGDRCKDFEALARHKTYSRPILMQHFPTYRQSDAACREHDAPEIELFRENWEVLSKESTDLIGALLTPRVAFAGHSHHYCLSINRYGIEEYTVASFSWRNKVEPSFLLATFSTTNHAVSKCNMLPQKHVYTIYMLATTVGLGIIILHMYQKIFGTKV